AWMPRKSLHGRTCGVSCDGGRARTYRVGRCAWKSSAGCALLDHEASAPGLMHTARQTAFQMSAEQLPSAVSLPRP
ncbi:hypothetical protein XaCFBP7622_14895, partial [Xanthomonas arboricola]